MKSSGKAILGQEGSANRSCHAGTATSKNVTAVMAAEMRIALRARRRIRSFQQSGLVYSLRITRKPHVRKVRGL